MRPVFTFLACVSVAAFTQGCAGGPWYVDRRFTPDEQADIQKAASMWESVGQNVDLVFGAKVSGYETTGKHIVRETDRGARMIHRDWQEGEAGRFSGSTPDMWRESLVLVPQNSVHQPLYVVTAHELGHSFGLEHVSDPTALMYRENSPTAKFCITKSDIEEMCRTAGCPGETPKGCDE